MPRGQIAALYGDLGQVIHEGNAYNFTLKQVEGGIRNHEEVEFEFDESGNSIKIIFGRGGRGVNKPTNKSKPSKKKENTTSKLVDNRELLTEEK